MSRIWNETLSTLRAEVPEHHFNTWIRPIHVRTEAEEGLILEVPNTFYRDKLQQNYAELIRTKVRQIAHSDTIDISFVVQNRVTSLRDVNKVKKEIIKQERLTPVEGLNPKYIFETFVVGNSNQFAHAAANAVGQMPGKTYNPLFIYGGVGLGKTHLLSAVGNQIASQNRGAKIIYRPGEAFTNEMIHAIRFEKMPEFRARYRENCDVLLIDDVQFIAGKERTQEEFFHTFNTLHAANKQIVLTSDQYAKDIPDLDERLRSRFEWGLLADIQPPDMETRVAILKKKGAVEGVELQDDVAFYLAGQIRSNIRALEGALIRLTAYSSISGRPITLDMTQELFGSLASQELGVSVDQVLKKVADFYHLSVADLKSARRHRVIALPRQIAMYLSRKLTNSSFPEIGSSFGGKDHTTIMHGVERIEFLLETDVSLKSSLCTIEQAIHQG